MSAEWYCLIDDKICGPFHARELRDMASRGELCENHGVRRGNEGDWVLASTVKGLAFRPKHGGYNQPEDIPLATVQNTPSSPQPPREIEHLQSDWLLVTSKRIVVGGVTYAVPHITCVKLSYNEPNRLGAVAVIFMGVMILGYGVAAGILTLGVIGACVVVFGFVLAHMEKGEHMVLFRVACGQSHAVKLPNERLARTVLAAINKAITDRY